jgi:uncharacterized protein (UPF0261 family)
MKEWGAIAIVGTFDSKGEEHFFLKDRIEQRGLKTVTIHVGTKHGSPFSADRDLYEEVVAKNTALQADRDKAIQAVLEKARALVWELYKQGEICALISAGGGTGTHLGTAIMQVLPMGVPKVMVSTVASRDMSGVVGTKDISMIHSVVDLLGVNSLSGRVLDRAAGAVCGMARSEWKPREARARIALTMFGFITEGAEQIKGALETKGYEVVAFHANGTGGTAMEELAREGHFDGIMDLATHELADDLKGGYCAGMGPARLLPAPGRPIPRLVVPGGLDCAVLEFTRANIPEAYRDRRIFFYDFRSAIRLSLEETEFLAAQLARKMNADPKRMVFLNPVKGWSEADREGGPLHAPELGEAFMKRLRQDLDPRIEVRETDHHINDLAFARVAAETMDRMVQKKGFGGMPPSKISG